MKVVKFLEWRIQKKMLRSLCRRIFSIARMTTTRRLPIQLVFLLRLDEEGNVTDVSTDFIASVTQTEAEEFARKVLNEKRQVGYYKNYRFQILAKKNDNIVIFLNTTMELRSVRNVLLISCLVGVVCFLVVFLLVILLSKRAMKPYIRNIERQKRFITDASHEIKTPLTSIATSEVVIEMEYGEDEWTRNIHKQTSKMSRMVADLVTLSRLDEENPFLERTEFSLSDAVWDVAVESDFPLPRQ